MLASHWSMPLCLLPDQDTGTVAGMVLDAVQARVADLVAASSQATAPVDVLCPEHGITSAEGRAAVRRDPRVTVFTAEPPVLIVRMPSAGRLSLPVPAPVAGRLVREAPWLVGGMAVVIAVLAEFVAGWERDACAQQPVGQQAAGCAGRPVTYLDALYWLLNRLSGGDPDGLGARTFYARSVGLLVTLMSVVVGGGVITSLVQQAVARTRRFGHEVTEEYNATVRAGTPSSADGASAAVPQQRSAPPQGMSARRRARMRAGSAAARPTPLDRSGARCARDGSFLAGFVAGLTLGAVLTRRRRR